LGVGGWGGGLGFEKGWDVKRKQGEEKGKEVTRKNKPPTDKGTATEKKKKNQRVFGRRKRQNKKPIPPRFIWQRKTED